MRQRWSWSTLILFRALLLCIILTSHRRNMYSNMAVNHRKLVNSLYERIMTHHFMFCLQTQEGYGQYKGCKVVFKYTSKCWRACRNAKPRGAFLPPTAAIIHASWTYFCLPLCPFFFSKTAQVSICRALEWLLYCWHCVTEIVRNFRTAPPTFVLRGLIADVAEALLVLLFLHNDG